MKNGTKVLSRDGKFVGAATGSTHSCRMEGCRGQRVTVKWEDGKITHPCSDGMKYLPDGSVQII